MTDRASVFQSGNQEFEDDEDDLNEIDKLVDDLDDAHKLLGQVRDAINTAISVGGTSAAYRRHVLPLLKDIIAVVGLADA